jgi:hypothetical protein
LLTTSCTQNHKMATLDQITSIHYRPHRIAKPQQLANKERAVNARVNSLNQQQQTLKPFPKKSTATGDLASELAAIQFKRKQLVGFMGRKNQAMNPEKDYIYEQLEDPRVREPSVGTLYSGKMFTKADAIRFKQLSDRITRKTSDASIPREQLLAQLDGSDNYGGEFDLLDFYDPHFESVANKCAKQYPSSGENMFTVDYNTFNAIVTTNQSDFGAFNSMITNQRAELMLHDDRFVRQEQGFSLGEKPM